MVIVNNDSTCGVLEKAVVKGGGVYFSLTIVEKEGEDGVVGVEWRQIKGPKLFCDESSGFNFFAFFYYLQLFAIICNYLQLFAIIICNYYYYYLQLLLFAIIICNY